MWLLQKKFKFEAAHSLELHDGQCHRLHGHSYSLIVILGGEELHDAGPKRGMVMDFADVKTRVKPLIDEYFEHQFLNDTVPVKDTTSEELARWVYQQLKIQIPEVLGITIEETDSSACTYMGDMVAYALFGGNRPWLQNSLG